MKNALKNTRYLKQLNGRGKWWVWRKWNALVLEKLYGPSERWEREYVINRIDDSLGDACRVAAVSMRRFGESIGRRYRGKR